MGPNLLNAGLGAVLDVSLDDSTPDYNSTLLTAWHERTSAIADALGWPDTATVQRVYPGGASLFVTAPIDQLMTATEVTESAWVFAEARANGGATDADLPALLAFADAEMRVALDGRRPLIELWKAAQRLGLNVTFDETNIFVGTGTGSRGWPLNAVPSVEEIDWLAIRDMPIVLVTGSNGKTTVVRMVAAMARAAGHIVGYTCTDGVWIGGEQVESGDYSGPAGARRVLQDNTVTHAVLETARGGMLRRGLAMQHATVAAIVTLSPDHFGSYGITDLAALADAKMIVARAVEGRGTLVYNSDIPLLVDAVNALDTRSIGVSGTRLNSFDATSPGRQALRESARTSPQIDADRIKKSKSLSDAPRSNDHPKPRKLGALASKQFKDPEMSMTADQISQIPATLNGSASHNVLNAAIALTIARELELGPGAIEALKKFGSAPEDNMGRLMLNEFGGITVVIDYAHNAQSVAALIQATASLNATRRAITLGTGGDRDDHALQLIANAAVDSGVIDFYIAKEMPKFLRGRDAGSISTVLLHALDQRGVGESQRTSAPDDMHAVRAALRWARPGDLLLLTVHDQREAVLALVDTLMSHNWQAGTPLSE